MGYYYAVVPRGHDEIYHYGIKGMKWGVRRYRKEDGSYTLAGKIRYGIKHRSKRAPTREQLLQSTDPDQIYKYRRHLSDRELQERLNRLNLEENMYRKTRKYRRINNAKGAAKYMFKTGAVIYPAARSMWKIAEKANTNPNWQDDIRGAAWNLYEELSKRGGKKKNKKG